MVQKSDTNPTRLREIIETRPRLKINASHLTSKKYKKEIQFAIAENYCHKGFDPDNFIKSGANMTIGDLNKAIAAFKECEEFVDIFRYPIKNMGPGELMLYFLIDDAYLAGGSEGGDLRTGTGSDKDAYEVKAAVINIRDNAVEGFKLGGTRNLAPIIQGLLDIKNRVGKFPAGVPMGEKAGVNKSQYEIMLKEFPSEMKALEKQFQDEAYKYFKTHKILILDNSSTSNRTGLCKYLGNVKKENINIGVLTSGTIKPVLSGLKLV